jgi:hypothetical protein
MKKWLETVKPDNRGESLSALQEVSKPRITSVADQYFTNLCRVGESQGRGAIWGPAEGQVIMCENFCGEVRHGHSSIGPEMVLALATDIYATKMLIDDKDTPMYTPSQTLHPPPT